MTASRALAVLNRTHEVRLFPGLVRHARAEATTRKTGCGQNCGHEERFERESPENAEPTGRLELPTGGLRNSLDVRGKPLSFICAGLSSDWFGTVRSLAG